LADFTSRFNELLTRNPGSNTDLAQALGVSKQCISTWKIGTSTPKPPTIRTIAEYFGVDVDWLNGSSDNPNYYLPPLIDPGEIELVSIWQGLNDRGQDALLRQARYLNDDPDMKRGGASNDKTTA